MVSHLFFYQLALIVLVWLFVILHVAWPRQHARHPQPAVPIAPRRQRSNDPKPFAGLLQRPHCAACAHDAAYPQPPPPVRPDPMPPTHRRPRKVDTSQHCCPHTGCRYHGWLGLGNLRANGHPSGGRWRQFHCTACKGYFPEHHGTLFQGKQVAVELLVRVLACLAEGIGIRATARGFEVDPNTVLRWLGEAAEQRQAFSRYVLCEVHVKQVQLDEGYLPAMVGHFGMRCHPERRQDKGPWPKPRWMPLPGLLYGQLVKQYRRKHLVGVKHRVVFGTRDAMAEVLAAWGWKIDTSFVERLNLDLRQRVAAIGRRVNTLCQREDSMRQQLVLFQVYHNFVLPHASLREALAAPIPTNGSGSAKLWRPCTPAMAVGLTDHVWSLREVMMFRVPPWPQPQTV
jgi:hypothetical protein